MTEAAETQVAKHTSETLPSRVKHEHIFEALCAAQAEFLPVRKNCTAKISKTSEAIRKYADLGEILSATRPALNRHGIYLYQTVESNAQGVIVETVLAHESGETIQSGKLFMPSAGTGNMTGAQAFGSARTYACRYSISSFLGIAADDDDDGASAGTPGNFAGTPPQKQAPRRQQQQQPTANQPTEPILTEDTVEEGKLAAESGMAGYQAFWNHQSSTIRKLLISSGWHESLKAQAAAADASNNGGQAA